MSKTIVPAFPSLEQVYTSYGISAKRALELERLALQGNNIQKRSSRKQAEKVFAACKKISR